MRFSLALLICASLTSICGAEEEKNHYKMSMNDEFVVAPKDSWNVEEEKYMPLRFANVKVEPKEGAAFSLMLYFKCDTSDLAQFDSIEKMEKAVKASTKPYLTHAVEKAIKIHRIEIKGSYGCYATITDAEVAKQKEIKEGDFKYLTRGMIRLSKDSALGFSLMTNDLDAPAFRKVMGYIQSFVKATKTEGT